MSSKGFTLIELICVLAILGIILAIALPRTSFVLDNIILDMTAREIVSQIKHTQQRAIDYKLVHYFDLDAKNKNYTVRDWYNKPLFSQKGELNSGIKSITANLPSLGSSGDKSRIYRLQYGIDGIPTQTGTITITNKAGKQKKITIAVGTGRVKIIK